MLDGAPRSTRISRFSQAGFLRFPSGARSPPGEIVAWNSEQGERFKPMSTTPAAKYNFKYAFTSSICPEWTAAALVDGMQTYKFDGVELVMGQGHLHGVDLDTDVEFLTEVRKTFDEADMAVAALGTSFSFASPDITEREKSIANAKQALRMAETLGAPYVRVVAGEMPPGLEATGVVDYVSEALSDLTEFAEEERIRSMILVETAGSFSHSKYITEVMAQVYSEKIGVLWNVLHPMRVLEQPERTFDVIGEYVRHVHVIDAAFNEDRTKVQPCELGEGFVPMNRVVDLLKSAAYRGYLSIETVQKDLDPDETLPKYAEYLKGLLSTVTEPA